ncbi:hypothetical protein CDL15_Pgr024312 [Punica granatum]|uniref:Uncharacterized protein n=2 Tax=Punica granatum TaxID=22663 RepID=A0A218XX90_PUNGR|nr:hypothetical protein CDL15_Pgr024312 [Punica granatum]
MPPKRMDHVEDVHDRDNLRRLEQRMDRILEQLTQQMVALMENQNRKNHNPTADLEDIKYDSNSEGDAILFSEEDPSDDAFSIAEGNGKPKFNKEEEIVTNFNIDDSGL